MGAPSELLSRLADGDCDGSVTPRACAQWAADARVRETWHCYQLIGDVMRSEDLRPSARGDAAFLAALRVRLADEPARVAPGALSSMGSAAGMARASRRWATPAALVAGVAAVVGVAVVMRGQQAGDATSIDARLAAGGPAAAAAGTAVEAQASMIRDARLDRYLQAHHGVRIGATAALPGGGLRNVDMLVPSR